MIKAKKNDFLAFLRFILFAVLQLNPLIFLFVQQALPMKAVELVLADETLGSVEVSVVIALNFVHIIDTPLLLLLFLKQMLIKNLGLMPLFLSPFIIELDVDSPVLYHVKFPIR